MSRKIVVTFSALVVSAALAAALGLLIWTNSSLLVVDSTHISLNAKGERIYKGELFTGEAISYHGHKQPASSDQFVDGRRHGYSKRWFENGVLASEIYYQSSRREGFARFWWSNGTLKSESFYINGKKDGEARSWYHNGNKFKRSNFSLGRPTGLQQAWRENGDLFSNFEYKNGRVYGLNKADTCMGVKDEVLSPGYYEDQSS